MIAPPLPGLSLMAGALGLLTHEWEVAAAGRGGRERCEGQLQQDRK